MVDFETQALIYLSLIIILVFFLFYQEYIILKYLKKITKLENENLDLKREVFILKKDDMYKNISTFSKEECEKFLKIKSELGNGDK